MTNAITRRLFLRRAPVAVAAAGALVSTAALAEPVAEVAKPVFKVGSLSISVRPEVVAAIAEWNKAADLEELALEAYGAWCRTVPIGIHTADMPDQTIRNAWIDADTAENSARNALLRLLRASTAGRS